MSEKNGNAAVAETTSPKTDPQPAVDLSAVFYGKGEALVAPAAPPSAPKTDGLQSSAEKPTPAPAEAPKAEEKKPETPKGEEEKRFDEQRNTNRRLGSELKEAKDQLQQATEQIKMLQAKLDGTYQEPPKPTQEQVLAQERFRAKEQASRPMVVERFGEEIVNRQIYDKDSKFNQLVASRRDLAMRVIDSDLPAMEAMYAVGQEDFEAKYGRDPYKWVEKIEAELRPIILEEFKKQAATQPVGSPAPTVSEARGTGGGSTASRTLEQIFYPTAKP